jgi:hypothetical protein
VASNFKIVVHRNSENLHLRLTGDFDSISAKKLLNVLDENCAYVRKIFLHTSCLKNIYPSAQELLRKNHHSTNGQSAALIFTGEKYLQVIS